MGVELNDAETNTLVFVGRRNHHRIAIRAKRDLSSSRGHLPELFPRLCVKTDQAAGAARFSRYLACHEALAVGRKGDAVHIQFKTANVSYLPAFQMDNP